jgi:hypothetical protein
MKKLPLKKTVKERFEELPEPYRTQVFENVKDTEDYDETFPCDSIEDALISSFTWASTPEGHDYWQELYNKYSPDKL